ncbi:hypothetical protein [Phenylobacterium sp.]|uniref:hypothetical protein n=1 Tax=Phenylobacterium sp. TaxID=1871053 RepID=UPI00281281A4|nr:hypothetical protein [Phenylobacterium sp.]
MLLPIGPGLPEDVRAVLKGFHDAISALQAPGAPTPLFATSQAGLPPASAYPRCLALVTDLNILAHSDGANWIRQDTGAVIV